MLSTSVIRSDNLVVGANDTQFRDSTYGLRIGHIIDSNGEAHCEDYRLAPQEVVWLVSMESVRLPSNITAIAHIRTALCNKGLLALNTGIVDSGWNAPLATPVLNFGKTPHILHLGEEFLRLTFHGHTADRNSKEKKTHPAQYLRERQESAITYFGKKFLNSDVIIKEAIGSNVFKFVGIFGVLIALITIALTFAAILINSSAFYGTSSITTTMATKLDEMSTLRARIETMEKELREAKIQSPK